MAEFEEEQIRIHASGDFMEKIDEILGRVRYLTRERREEIMDLTALQNEVSNNTDVTQSAITLLKNLAAELQAAAGDPAAVQAIADQLTTNDQALAAAVAANTSAAPGTEATVPPADGSTATDATPPADGSTATDGTTVTQ